MSKSQIDRLGERLRGGTITEDDLRQLDEYRRSFAGAYESTIRRLRDELHLEPTGRPAKSTTALREKLQRETARLSQIQDIAGCRVVVANIAEQDRVVSRLVAMFPGSSVIDRRLTPSYGYRAVHVVVRELGNLIEIQVRTEVQHRWAELSEKFADVVDPAIKYGGGDRAILDVLLELSKVIAGIEKLEVALPIVYPNDEADGEVQREKLEAQKMRLAAVVADAIAGLARRR